MIGRRTQRVGVLGGLVGAIWLFVLALVLENPLLAAASPLDSPTQEYLTGIRPLLRKYCYGCHSTADQKGSLDLERFATVVDLRKDTKIWQGVLEQLEAGEMPPRKKPQPTRQEKQRLMDWVKAFLDREARARVGDPGSVPLRRLSNAEYDNTVRDLTGMDLRPSREFPADGAAGEGFTNASEALTDISPALLGKYLGAAKEIADHAVLLPDGFRFSASKTRRDWTNESTRKLQRFYAAVAPLDGNLEVEPYLTATIRYREALRAGSLTTMQVAQRENLNPKYLRILWNTLLEGKATYPLNSLIEQWRKAGLQDVPSLVTEIKAWQAVLWGTAKIGNYGRLIGNNWVENYSRQFPNDPAAVEVLPLRVTAQPVPGQRDVTLYLTSNALEATPKDVKVVWQRPRFEATGKPTLLLRNYPQYKTNFEVDYRKVHSHLATYLAAAVEAAHDRQATVKIVANKHHLDESLLQRWIELLALVPASIEHNPTMIGRSIPMVNLEMLDEKIERLANKPWLNGWRKRGNDLPILVANASDTVEFIPGKAAARSITVHPVPTKFVGVLWQSPITGKVRFSASVKSAHPACGNGIAWWFEFRRDRQARVLEEGTVARGGAVNLSELTMSVHQGDQLLLAVDARDGDHTCDLTDLSWTITEETHPPRRWDLAGDVAGTVHAGNPHADNFGNKGTWSFLLGSTRTVMPTGRSIIPPGSLLDKWRECALVPNRQAEAKQLGKQLQQLLTGERPQKENDPDRLLYDRLLASNSALFMGVDLPRLSNPRPPQNQYGLPVEHFTIDANLVSQINNVIEVRIPAALMHGREFVVECRLESPNEKHVAHFQATVSPVRPRSVGEGKSTVVASRHGSGYRQLTYGFAEFRRLFPRYLCFPNVIANDEVVSLKMFHRDDEPLLRLFLESEPTQQLDKMWLEHAFVSEQAIAENAHLPQFIEFVTQDGTPEALAFFKSLRPSFQRRADEFQRVQHAATSQQLQAFLALATRAFRRPISEQERTNLLGLYQVMRRNGESHEKALRALLVRVFVAPAFLFRIENSPPGTDPGWVNDWELATRLSYFLWASMPDEELRRLAAAGQLRNPTVIVAQMQRMLKDSRVRSLAIEFGTQWIHVRGFDQFNEKNERLFPTFNGNLRAAMYEESILFFQDFFQNNRTMTDLLDTDASYLNESLAKHYGIPGVKGEHWRRVTGVKQYGRGGLLGLASVQASQAGASRTSPILRGNWVVETLLGEKLPKPPPDVPKLPEMEGGTDHLSMRQLVERHTRVAECAVCHQRIDPFGFALEKYDAIGRRRERDAGGLQLDAKVRLRDGTEFEGLDGLRTYLTANKREVVTRLFCRRLLGYALGRTVTLSDTHVVEDMVSALHRNQGRIHAAVKVIVCSPQFRMVRGSAFAVK